jgi:predicted nucleic acid-binding protein
LNYLLDTNVLSEPKRPRPDPKVMSWIESAPLPTLFISVLSLGELTRGIALMLKRDLDRAEFYRDWLLAVRRQYAGRVLAVDAGVAETWGMMSATGSLAVADALLAATARMHGLVLATRNRRDFENLGVEVFDPWTD